MTAILRHNGFQLRPEQFTLELSVAGRPAGEMAWQIAPDKGTWTVRAQTDFGGALPELRRVQVSRVDGASLTSLGYTEGDGKRASFETVADSHAGLLTLRQGKDEASVPLLGDVHDPLSTLLWLRAYAGKRAELRLAGGHVLVRRLPEEDVDGLRAHTFELRPGGALVSVEDAPGRRLLRLVQPADFGPLTASLRAEAPARERVRPRRREGKRRR